MELILLSVLCFCVGLSSSEDMYRAGVIQDTSRNLDYNGLLPHIREAGKSNVDIVVLPIPSIDVEISYDETVKSLAKAARQAELYVVAHLYEKTRCQNKNEIVRSNLVFNRDGNIVSVYRKPIGSVVNCTSANSDIVTFTTDFGVKFRLMMEEDLILHNPGHLKGVNNFIVAGESSSEIPILSSNQISPSWAFVTNANLISQVGIFAGQTGARSGESLVVADLHKNGGQGLVIPPVINPGLSSMPYEDLSEYTIRPVDLESSSQGYTETVCHKKFCCEFYIKTKVQGSKSSALNYGLAAFDGTRYFGQSKNIGTQTCAVFACAGLYKRSCDIGSNNSTDIIFENLTIRANFTKHNTVQYPIILTAHRIQPNQFDFDIKTSKSKQVVTKLENTQFLTFGIFGREFSKDFEKLSNNTDSTESDVLGFLYNEDVQGFIDYVWIRLRILIFVVSIYILEMM